MQNSESCFVLFCFLTCIALNARPHDLHILFCTISLFMDHMIFIAQFGKKNACDAMLIFLLCFCYCLLRGFSSARLCSGFPQLCWKGQYSCASKRVLQSPVSPASQIGVCCHKVLFTKSYSLFSKTLWLSLQGMRSAGCHQWDSGPAAHWAARKLS